MIFYDGTCDKCETIVEFRSSMVNRDVPRFHKDLGDAACTGTVQRRPCTGFATRWHYGKADKIGCLMGPSNNVYHDRNKIKKTRIVSGPKYSGPVSTK